MTKLLATLACLFLLCFSVQAQTIISVPADFPTIQEALDAAEPNTNIEVSPGTYYEHVIWPQAKDDVHLIGSGAEETIIDGSGAGQVMIISDVENASVSGFTIQNGYYEVVNNGPYEGGAGMYIDESNLLLEGLIIQNNRGFKENFGKFKGAGVYINQFEGEIKNCVFLQNTINAYSAMGAGLFANNFSGNIESCDFTSNEIDGSYHLSGGGAIIFANGDVNVTDCKFNGNLINRGGGGAALNLQSTDDVSSEINVEISNSLFIDNSIVGDTIIPSSGGGAGAGIVIGDDIVTATKYLRSVIDSCLFRGNTILGGINGDELIGIGAAILSLDKKITISNSIFENNKSRKGACIHTVITDLFDAPIEEINIESCYFGSNTAEEGSVLHAGVSFETLTKFTNCVMTKNIGSTIFTEGLMTTGNIYYTDITLDHCTIAFNEGTMNFDLAEFNATNTIFWNPGVTEFVSEGSNFTMKNCLIEGGGVGQNTITDDPLFVSEDDLKPMENSPCIGAGVRSLNLDHDLEGNPRPMPAGSNPDIGAYELVYGISSIQDEYSLEFDIFPNPVADRLYFDDVIDVYKIYDVSGKLVLEGFDQKSISVNELSSGVYSIMVEKKGKKGSLKFVK